MAEPDDVDYELRVLDSPLQIAAQQWNALLATQLPAQACAPFMRHEYLAALHKSGSATPATGWTPRFITLWQGPDLAAACPLYLKDHSYGEYVFDHAWAQAYHQHHLAYYPKALVAVPFTPVPGPRLLARTAVERQKLLEVVLAWCQAEQLSSLHLLFVAEQDAVACADAGLMLRHTVQFHWKNVAPTLVAARTALPPEGEACDLGRPGVANVAPTLVNGVCSLGLAGRSSRDASPLSPVQSCSSSFGAAGSSPSEAACDLGRFGVASVAPTLGTGVSTLPLEGVSSDWGERPPPGPGHVLTQGYADFDDFLASLNQDKRKKIRQERRKVAQAGVQFRWSRGRDISAADWAFFYRCYERNYHEHGNAPYLTPAFFQYMQNNLPEYWLLFVAEQQGQPIATSLVALSEGYSKAAGPNEAFEGEALEKVAYGRYWGALERIDCLHFEACYYQPLQWCIAHGFARFEGGAQGEHKMARALLPVTTSSAHWLAHPAFADAVERFVDRESAGVANYMQDLARRSPLRQD